MAVSMRVTQSIARTSEKPACSGGCVVWGFYDCEGESRTREFLYRVDQQGLLDRLAEMRVDAGFESAADIFIQGGGGKGDDRRTRKAAFALPIANCAGRFAPVHHGPLNIHQHQAVLLGFYLCHCDLPIFAFSPPIPRSL